MPVLGLRVPARPVEPTIAQRDRLRLLNLSFLRADLVLADRALKERYVAIARIAATLDVPVELGLHVSGELASVYVISGCCAALGGIVSVAKLGAVSPTFGSQREFAAIAAAVLGGTSLFGGRGNVLPGTLLGAVLIQTVETGLNMINADPYSYPVVLGAIIFFTVLINRLRFT